MVVAAHEDNVEDRNKSLLNLNTQENTRIITGTKSTLYINENRQTQLKTEGYIYTQATKELNETQVKVIGYYGDKQGNNQSL